MSDKSALTNPVDVGTSSMIKLTAHFRGWFISFEENFADLISSVIQH